MNLERRYGAVPQRRRPPARGRIASYAVRKSQRLSFGQAPLKVKLVLLTWLILVLDPHLWLASLGLPRPIVARAHLVTLALLVVYLPAHRIRHLAPFTAYTCFVLLAVPFAFNRGMAMPYAKLMMVVGVVSLAVLTFVRRPPHIRFVLLTLLLYRYVWFGIQGVAVGRVPWNPLFGNQDGFGALMGMGLVSSAALAMGATDRRLRHVAVFAAVLCVGGLVSSFARGAFLAGGIGLAFLWYRARGRRLAYAVTAVLVVGATGLAGSFFSDVETARGGGSRSFWTEISSIGQSLTNPEEEERTEVWRVGWQVFVDNPLLGVGTGSWGPYAAYSYTNDYEVLGDRFFSRPNQIYNRAMHNVYLQLLAEQGIVGTALFFWILVDFWVKSGRIRRKSHKEDSSVLPGVRTRMVATAFEATMVVALATGMLYNVLGFWFFAVIIAQSLFYSAWAKEHTVHRHERLQAAR